MIQRDEGDGGGRHRDFRDVLVKCGFKKKKSWDTLIYTENDEDQGNGRCMTVALCNNNFSSYLFNCSLAMIETSNLLRGKRDKRYFLCNELN